MGLLSLNQTNPISTSPYPSFSLPLSKGTKHLLLPKHKGLVRAGNSQQTTQKWPLPHLDICDAHYGTTWWLESKSLTTSVCLSVRVSGIKSKILGLEEVTLDPRLHLVPQSAELPWAAWGNLQKSPTTLVTKSSWKCFQVPNFRKFNPRTKACQTPSPLPPPAELGALSRLGAGITQVERAQYQLLHDAALLGLRALATAWCGDPVSGVPSHTAFLSSLLGWVLSDMQGCLLLPGCHDDKQCSSWTSSLLWPLASNYRAHSWSGQTRGNPSYPPGSRRKIQGYFLTVTRFLVGLTLTSFSVSSISESTYL